MPSESEKIETREEIKIIFRDENLVIVDKPSGIMVHPYKRFTNDRRTLMKLLRNQIDQYVYPLHRLDRQVSGVIIFGLNGEIIKDLQERWHNPETVKEYISLVKGNIPEDGMFKFPLRDKRFKQKALTLFWPLFHFEDSTLVKIQIKTGRKHQIRRHFSRRMHHLIGDRRYGYRDMNEEYLEKYGLDRIFLHCRKVKIEHPLTQKECEWVSDLPSDLKEILVKKGMHEELFSRGC